MTKSATYILLIRHGENDWVGAKRLAGRTPGVHLNETGRRQAADLAALLAPQPIMAVYSSPLERCMETAQPVADARDLPVQPTSEIVEVDYGEWRGGELKELAQRPEWQAVQHYPSQVRFPGGETLREVQFRAVGFIEELRTGHPNQAIAVFSHGDVIRTTVAHYLGAPIDLFQRVAISTASISVVAFFDQRPMVLAVNHLSTLPSLTSE